MEGHEFNPNDDKEVRNALKSFESKARETTGQERKVFRKPEPRKTLVERVRIAIKQQEEEEASKNF